MTLDPEILTVLKYPKIHQIGIVVEDMAKAVSDYSKILGISRWYRAVPGGKEEIYYRGKRVNCNLDFVMGFCGTTQVELIATEGEKNLYTDFLETHGPGLHHICYFVSDLDKKLAACKALGLEPIQHGTVCSKGGTVTRYAYLIGPASKGLIVELSESRLGGKIAVKMTPLMMKVGKLTGDLVLVTVD